MDDCQDCGACCLSESDERVHVTPNDRACLGEQAEQLVVVKGGRAFLRVDRSGPVGRCAALEIGDDERFFCAIYDRRPEICRSFERGSPSCQVERALKGARTRRLLHEIGRTRVIERRTM